LLVFRTGNRKHVKSIKSEPKLMCSPLEKRSFVPAYRRGTKKENCHKVVFVYLTISIKDYTLLVDFGGACEHLYFWAHQPAKDALGRKKAKEGNQRSPPPLYRS
jgi:hypothetical protein